jgi:hypothetical protein
MDWDSSVSRGVHSSHTYQPDARCENTWGMPANGLEAEPRRKDRQERVTKSRDGVRAWLLAVGQREEYERRAGVMIACAWIQSVS